MMDAALRPWIEPPLARLAEWLDDRISANAVTIAGFGVGVAAMIAVMWQAYILALLGVVINRLADGLDGAIARRSGVSDLGGYLDITLDFIFYAGMVFAFAVADPQGNALAAAFLIFSFIGTGCSFLAFAIMAARRKLESSVRGKKSFYYLGGLTEGSETIALLVTICLLPWAFAPIAWVFGALCWVTTASRIAMACEAFAEDEAAEEKNSDQTVAPISGSSNSKTAISHNTDRKTNATR